MVAIEALANIVGECRVLSMKCALFTLTQKIGTMSSSVTLFRFTIEMDHLEVGHLSLDTS